MVKWSTIILVSLILLGGTFYYIETARQSFIYNIFIGEILNFQGYAGEIISSNFTEKLDSYELIMDSQLEDSGENKVIISKTEPNVILEKWNGEIKLGVRYLGVNASGLKDATKDIIEWKETYGCLALV